MSEYKHGIGVNELETKMPQPKIGTSGLQVIFGTAPVNMTDDPTAVVHKLVLINTFEEAKAAFGYSTDFNNYTLCQSMLACFSLFNIAPIIMCNVLDPTKHKKAVLGADYAVSKLQAIINVSGVILSSIVVKNGENTLTLNTDYITSFNNVGYALVTLLASGTAATATSLTITADKLDPSAVTEEDIIGGYDVSTGKEMGLELIRRVFPTFGLAPGLIVCPGWSKYPTVGAAMDSKCTEINGCYTCETLLDISTASATKYTDVDTVKETNGWTGKHSIVLWPMVKADKYIISYSALMAAKIAYLDASSDDVPDLSTSNKLLGITGAVLADGTEVSLDEIEANTLNAKGIVTIINDNGFRSWGNNTACYPKNTDVKDRWINCRRFFSWWANQFIRIYHKKIDSNASYKFIESIVDAENIRCNSYVSNGKCAGAYIEFNQEDNPIENILDGKIKFKQYLATYIPAEYISNDLEYDISMLEAEMAGE